MSQIVDRNAALEDMVRRDPLTGIANRRGFEDWCQTEVTFGQRESDLHFFAILDIDHFKSVNDQYGHDVGDEVLKRVATLLAQSLRDSDMAARWGGEEFCILLTDLDHDQAYSTLERIRALIEATVVTVGDVRISVTASIGVTSIREKADLAAAFKRADEALYEAKDGGRNQIKEARIG